MRQPHDLTPLVGTRYGDRTITAITRRKPAGPYSAPGPQVLEVTCDAGHVVMYQPSHMGEPRKCNRCGGTRVR